MDSVANLHVQYPQTMTQELEVYEPEDIKINPSEGMGKQICSTPIHFQKPPPNPIIQQTFDSIQDLNIHPDLLEAREHIRILQIELRRYEELTGRQHESFNGAELEGSLENENTLTGLVRTLSTLTCQAMSHLLQVTFIIFTPT